MDSGPSFRKIDCLRLPVKDLSEALAFYGDKLGHVLLWRTASSAGLLMPDSQAELVLHTEGGLPEVDLTVDSVPDAVERFRHAGGTVETPTFEIPIGRCAVIRDPWGNQLTLLDLSKGLLVSDPGGEVVGVESVPILV